MAQDENHAVRTPGCPTSGGVAAFVSMKRWLFLFLLAANLHAATPTVQDAQAALQAGRLDEAKAVLDQILATDPRNAAAQNISRVVAQALARRAAARQQLERVTIPTLDLKDASAREAVDYTLQLIGKNSPQGTRPNLVWMVPPDFPGRVTIRLDNVPGATALEYVVGAAGLAVGFEEHAIRVTPAR